MAECSEIEAGGEVRTIKDATARNGVAANADAIAAINAKIPSTASQSNQMVTAADLKPALDYINETPIEVTATVTNPNVGNKVYCYPKQKKIQFYLGGDLPQNLVFATFAIPQGFTFNIRGWGLMFNGIARNKGSGAVISIPIQFTIANGVGNLSIVNAQPGYDDIRIQGETVFSLP